MRDCGLAELRQVFNAVRARQGTLEAPSHSADLVLILDDDVSALAYLVLVELIWNARVEVIWARSVAAANLWKEAESRGRIPDLIMTDQCLGFNQRSGLDFVQQNLRWLSEQRIPVLVTSTEAQETSMQRAWANQPVLRGADGQLIAADKGTMMPTNGLTPETLIAARGALIRSYDAHHREQL